MALDGRPITPAVKSLTILLNKPAGYVVSRDGQGSQTVYDLLPAEYHSLKPVGRLDKDSSGLLLMTNDGELANRLTHPRYAKEKVYEVTLDKTLAGEVIQSIRAGIQLEDGPSALQLKPLDASGRRWQVTMSEGRNRQIRRTFGACGYKVKALKRVRLGPYSLNRLTDGAYRRP